MVTCTSQCQLNIFCHLHLRSLVKCWAQSSNCGRTICKLVDCDESNDFVIERSTRWSPTGEPRICDEISNFVIEASPGLKPK
jgi:hypothetical protein